MPCETYNSDMPNIAEIRRKNFLRLLDEFTNAEHNGIQRGSTTAFCRKYDINPTYMSQMKSGDRAIGEPQARQLEKKCGKPERWLDDDKHLIDTTNPKQVAFFEVAMTLYDLSPELAQTALMKAAKELMEEIKK